MEMKKKDNYVHFADSFLLNPTNPIVVNLIGAGGTGSQVLTCLARMHQSLLQLNHAGLMVRLFDDDRVSIANLGRQLFAQSEIGMFKSVALINRINRFFGTNWKAVTQKYQQETWTSIQDIGVAPITVSCVDTASARFEIARLLQAVETDKEHHIMRPLYWMDFGNSRHTGQVVLSTVTAIQQPKSRNFSPIEKLPFVTEEFRELLVEGDKDDTPSCSLADALSKQDLFINSTLAQMGVSLLWQLFREGMVFNRGFFLNLKDFRSQPLRVA